MPLKTLAFLVSPVPSFRFTGGESGLFSFRAGGSRRATSLPASPLGNRDKKKTSLRISREVLGNLERNTKRGKRLRVSSTKCRLSQKVPKFLSTTALQHCKLSFLLAEVSWRISPALSFQLSILFLPFTSCS